MILIAQLFWCITFWLPHEHFSVRPPMRYNVFTLPGFVIYDFLQGARFTLILSTDSQLFIFIFFLFVLIIITYFQVPPPTLIVFSFYIFMPESLCTKASDSCFILLYTFSNYHSTSNIIGLN